MENAGEGWLPVLGFVSERLALRGGPRRVGGDGALAGGACGVEAQCGVEELVEWLGRVALGVELSVLVGVDAYDLVEDLVELSLDMLWCRLVELVAVLGQGERVGEVGQDAVVVGGSALEFSLDSCQFRAEAVLLFLEQISGDGVLVVELEELALLVLQVVSGCLELRDALPLLGGREGDLLGCADRD